MATRKKAAKILEEMAEIHSVQPPSALITQKVKTPKLKEQVTAAPKPTTTSVKAKEAKAKPSKKAEKVIEEDQEFEDVPEPSIEHLFGIAEGTLAKEAKKKRGGYAMIPEVDAHGEPTGRKTRVAKVKSAAKVAAGKARFAEADNPLKLWNEKLKAYTTEQKKKDPSWTYRMSMEALKKK